MKLSASTIGFWTNIAIFLVIGAVEAYIITWVLSSDIFVRYSDFLADRETIGIFQQPLFWIILAICELLTVGSFLQSLRKQFLAVLPDSLKITQANAVDYPSLDRAKLEDYTESLSLQGFEHIIDFGAREVFSDRSKEIPGFSRLLINFDTNCYALLIQTFFPQKGTTPVYCTIASELSSGWTLVNTNVPTESATLFWRHKPQEVWFATPDASAVQLYRDHLNFRSQMQADLNIHPQPASEASYFEIEQQETKHRQNSIKKANILLTMLKATWFELNPYAYWLGNYRTSAGAVAKAKETVGHYGLA
jgi:hypothetical protein